MNERTTRISFWDFERHLMGLGLDYVRSESILMLGTDVTAATWHVNKVQCLVPINIYTHQRVTT